jgi:hypothetical protein
MNCGIFTASFSLSPELHRPRVLRLYGILTTKYTPLKLTFNPSKPEEREKRRWGAAIDTTFDGGRGGAKIKFTAATKVPRQCPLLLLEKVGLVKERRLGVEKVN